MGDEEFDTKIQHVLRSLSRDQLERVALAMARQLNRERQQAVLISLGIMPDDPKQNG
jgi:hypothetical protein